MVGEPSTGTKNNNIQSNIFDIDSIYLNILLPAIWQNILSMSPPNNVICFTDIFKNYLL